MSQIRELQEEVNKIAHEKGHWSDDDGKKQDPHNPYIFATKIALIHEETSESLQAMRGGNPPKRKDT